MKLPSLDKHIPLPALTGRPTVYPFSEMKVGDSFFVPKPLSTVSAATFYYSKKNGIRLACRSVTEKNVDGTRVWRIK